MTSASHKMIMLCLEHFNWKILFQLHMLQRHVFYLAKILCVRAGVNLLFHGPGLKLVLKHALLCCRGMETQLKSSNQAC